jgi:hypothetical protein
MLSVPSPMIYDSFTKLHEARLKHFTPLPEGFLLYRLFASPYDWRLDLTETAKGKVSDLKRIQDGPFGRRSPDTDDEVAVAGHSTGGILIRRILAEPEAEQLVSHAFFMNVPFRGAVKTMSVIPTGRDPLAGPAMIPIVTANSLRAIVLSAPIVYHLSASAAYPHPIYLEKRAGAEPSMYSGLDAERRWVELAISAGLMPTRKIVPTAEVLPLTSAERRAIAYGADAWAHFWDERAARRRERVLLEWALPGKRDTWEQRELVKRGLVGQNSVRAEEGWNEHLANRATAFHRACEEMAQKGAWAKKCYIFYSVSKEPTTLALEAELVSSERYSELLPALEAAGVTLGALNVADTLSIPTQAGLPRSRTSSVDALEAQAAMHIVGADSVARAQAAANPYGLVEDGVTLWESWSEVGQFLQRNRWRLAVLRQIDGDGTVPLASLIGFGGDANVFKKLLLPGEKTIGPEHVKAPNHPWAWDRILDVLQQIDVGQHLAHVDKDTAEDQARDVSPTRHRRPDTVDPFVGKDRDEHLPGLRQEYYLRHQPMPRPTPSGRFRW